MAVTKRNPASAALNALTLAALALPGLMAGPVCAEDDEVDIQYGHYQEGARNLYGATSAFKPIQVDSLNTSARVKLADRLRFAFNYIQDTWGGATPMATAPLAFGGNGNYTGGGNYTPSGTVSGATPYLNNHNVYFDRQLNPLSQDASGNFVKNTQLVHTMSMASPETRRQGDFKFGYDWDESAVDVGGGISVENDYESRFGNVAGRWDFNQKLTSVNAGVSYTNSDTHAMIDHDAQPYIYDASTGGQSYNATYGDISHIVIGNNGQRTLYGNKQDWASNFGLTQVLNKNALFTAGVGYSYSAGYMANPYKVVQVAFIPPDQTGDILTGTTTALLEQRPNQRNQLSGSLGYIQHVDLLDGAFHFNYKLFKDDWGITSHTFEADWVQNLAAGWTVTPKIRYYSQSAADFYNPYLISNQAIQSNAVDNLGREIFVSAIHPNNGVQYYSTPLGYVNAKTGQLLNFFQQLKVEPVNKTVPFNRAALPKYYSSDQRLSGYGALSGGLTVAKQFAKGISLEAGGEYYTHAGDLKLGGGGEGSYANFDYWMANATLKLDLSALQLANGAMFGFNDHNDGKAGEDNGNRHKTHKGHHQHQHGNAPAGVMFAHTLAKAGDMMVGYRYMYDSESGGMLHNSQAVTDSTLINNACQGNACYVTPAAMTMNMHMIDLMVAPTDWLTLMLMPQFVDMGMTFRGLSGAGLPSDYNSEAAVLHSEHPHATGGVGDTGLYAMFNLLDFQSHHIHATMGVTAPTGDVGIQLRPIHTVDLGFIHYGMQLGSGTWDLKPSLTYTGQWQDVSWGAQLNGTIRTGNKNASGYILGNMLGSTAWLGYGITPWLSTTLRGLYSYEGTGQYQYNGTYYPIGPMDYLANYGRQSVDMGLGVSATVPEGTLQGNRFSVEWLQPVSDDVNGYQLRRDGTLSATWGFGF